ncbi:MAG: branched-chain amino acid ABC transporter permease [Dehalococcoidia bacterium]|nr:branched-chain amino acid ABC transporter permease [Dehalococcoidia bacterium]
MSLFDQLLQFTIGGLGTGAIYAIVGLGFMIVYSVTRVVNFAQGEFVMIGGMLTSLLYAAGMPLLPAMFIAVVGAVLLGALIQRGIIHPARNASTVTLILLTFGISIVVRGIALLLWKTDPHSFPSFSGTKSIALGGAVFQPQTLWIVGTLAVLSVGLYLFFDKTMRGKAFQACAINPTAARIMGIKVETMALLAFALAAGMGAVAGIVTTPLTTTSYDIGIPMAVKGFVAALVGGLNRIEGVLLGGIVLGVLESLAAGLISSGFKDAIALVVLILVLVFRPGGLLGGAEAGHV